MKLELLNLVNYHDYQITSRSLSQKLGLDQVVTLYAMDKAETISQESSPSPKLIQVLEGQLKVSLAEEEAELLKPNELLTVPALKLHALKAVEKTKFLQIE
ncbi:acetate kinase [Streptococcus sobrinus]|uniref:acetate kinase n=1 Tax=Streptococcus sobrinus TaxID=1310 RepID=UPI000BA1B007|nr:acetate kinase [Streptococcus sobrinus]OZV23262.1 acetate kinase [Streptococcus sobrinus]